MTSKIDTAIVRIDPDWSDRFIHWLAMEHDGYLEMSDFEFLMEAFSCYLFWWHRHYPDPYSQHRILMEVIQGYHLGDFDSNALLTFLNDLYRQIGDAITVVNRHHTLRTIEPIFEDYILKGFVLHLYENT